MLDAEGGKVKLEGVPNKDCIMVDMIQQPNSRGLLPVGGLLRPWMRDPEVWFFRRMQ